MSGRSSSGAASPSTPAAAAAVDDETYPRWCLTAMLVITLIAFGSHAAPTDWLRSSRPVVQSVAAQESKVSTELFAAPSALPHAAVLEEVFDAVHSANSNTGSKGCMRAPKAWGSTPSRVSIPEAILTDPPLLVYYDVLVARDEVCKRLTRATHTKKGKGAPAAAAAAAATTTLAADGRSDSDRVVWTTHMNRGRMQRLMDLSLRWGGCMSVALWVCSQEDWDYVSKLHADNADIGNHVTFHAVLGHGAYPYNLQRNVALAPFAPWAVGNGRPAPWVVVADADGVPSVGEAQMSRAVTEAAAGKATAPPVITGAVPAELAWMGTGPLGIGAPEFDAAPFEYAAAKPEVCAAWDGLPEPMQCRASGHPSGLGWGRSWQTAAWATDRSRCGRPVDPARAFFVIPSFDTRRDNGEAIARLRAIDPTSPPSHAWAYLRKLWDHGIVELQAQESYAPSYESMVPWRAWRDAHPAGLLAVHYGFIYEPYIVVKTPFPSTSLDKWEPFDEYFREPGYDKCIFFTETAGLRADDPAKYYLHVLPQVFLLNDDAGTTSGPRPSRHMNWERFMAAAGEHGAWCQDMCPCVAYENMSVAPPQGFWDNRYLRRQQRALQGGGNATEGGEGLAAVEEEVVEREWSKESHFGESQRRALL